MSEFNKRKVVELLSTFSKQEVKDFTAYVAHHGSKGLLTLWKYVQQYHPKYKVSDVKVYQAVRSGKDFKDNVFRVWLTTLARLAKEFVALQEFRSNELLFNNTLSLALLKRRVGNMAQKALDKSEKGLAKTPRHSSLFYDYRYQNEDIAYQYVTLLDHRALTDTLQNSSNYLEHSFMIHKLKQLSVMRNRQRIVKESYDYGMEQQLLDYLALYPHTEVPLLHLYYLMLRLMRDLNDHEGFHQFLAYYKVHHPTIALEENRQLLTGAINFCLWNIREGHSQYLTHRFDLAKMMVNDQLILVEGYVPTYRFRSMIQIGIEAEELDWVLNFMVDWLPKTQKEHRRNLEAYSYAALYFARGDYQRQDHWMAVMKDADFTFIDTNNEIIFRTLVLKTAYQQQKDKPSSLFVAQLEAYRNYIERKTKVSDSYRKSAANFRKALWQMYQKRMGINLKVGNLRAYVLGLKPLREQVWLFEELKQLIGDS